MSFWIVALHGFDESGEAEARDVSRYSGRGQAVHEARRLPLDDTTGVTVYSEASGLAHPTPVPGEVVVQPYPASRR